MKGIQFIRITIQIWITIKPPLVYMAACRRNNILIALTGTPSVCPHIIVWFAHVGTSILKAFTGRPGLCPHRRVGIKPVAYRARTPIFHGVVVALALRTSPGKVVFRLHIIEFLNLMRYFCLLLTKHKFIKKSHVIFLKLRVWFRNLETSSCKSFAVASTIALPSTNYLHVNSACTRDPLSPCIFVFYNVIILF